MKYRNRDIDVLIDVRSRLETFFGRAPGAVCIPLGKLNAAELGRRGIARDASIVVYCASGARSGMAVGLLASEGFTRVTNGGGLSEVRQHLS